MKHVTFLTCICCFYIFTGAQEKVYKIAAGQAFDEVLTHNDIYQYPYFSSGNVYFKDGKGATALLNYNYLYGAVQFISPKGDTLALDNENTIKLITIGKDSFYYDDFYIKSIGSANNIKLGVKRQVRMTNSQNAGAFDQNMPSGGMSYSSFRNGNLMSNNLVMRENITLVNGNEYYLGDRFNQFTAVNRKNVLKMFSKKEKVVEVFLAENDINFKSEADILKLFTFLQTL